MRHANNGHTTGHIFDTHPLECGDRQVGGLQEAMLDDRLVRAVQEIS